MFSVNKRIKSIVRLGSLHYFFSPAVQFVTTVSWDDAAPVPIVLMLLLVEPTKSVPEIGSGLLRRSGGRFERRGISVSGRLIAAQK
jgi:hypothetical protein